jgi:predicted nucleotidyltransferase
MEGMTGEPQNEPVLKRFRATVAEVYGDRLERVVLYGSRARGDHQPDSDYDIAVFIKDPGTLTEELGQVGLAYHGHFARYRRRDFGEAFFCRGLLRAHRFHARPPQ